MGELIACKSHHLSPHSVLTSLTTHLLRTLLQSLPELFMMQQKANSRQSECKVTLQILSQVHEVPEMIRRSLSCHSETNDKQAPIVARLICS